MEIFGYHPDLKKWTEIGNSGMFRPEVRRAAGPRRRAREESHVGPAKNVPPSHRARAFFLSLLLLSPPPPIPSFRQMLLPMGLPENVRVIAWGLSLERPTMIKYRIKNIRDLFGHKVELARTRAAPICRFEPAA
jgi:phenylalanyl-tRNA synthetase alpha chain